MANLGVAVFETVLAVAVAWFVSVVAEWFGGEVNLHEALTSYVLVRILFLTSLHVNGRG